MDQWLRFNNILKFNFNLKNKVETVATPTREMNQSSWVMKRCSERSSSPPTSPSPAATSPSPMATYHLRQRPLRQAPPQTPRRPPIRFDPDALFLTSPTPSSGPSASPLTRMETDLHPSSTSPMATPPSSTTIPSSSSSATTPVDSPTVLSQLPTNPPDHHTVATQTATPSATVSTEPHRLLPANR